MTQIPDGDRRRLVHSTLISLPLWLVLLLLTSLIGLPNPEDRDSMNPVYISLELEEPPPTQLSSASSAAAGVTQETAATSAEPIAAQESVAATAPAAVASAQQAAPAAAVPNAPLRADPAAAAAPVRAERRVSRYQSGEAPLAPLSEEGLATRDQAPAIQEQAAPRTASADRIASVAASGAASAADGYSRQLESAGSALAATPVPARTGSTASGGSGGSGSSGTGTSGAGDLSGEFDFGNGPSRELWSSRKLRVSDKLLAGQPNVIATNVSFTIESGGTVLPGTIRFDPPLSRDIENFLRQAFSSWIFSPADSNGQVNFRYSIKVR